MQNDDITIRKFKSSDLDTVRDLVHNTIDVCYPDIYCAEAIKYFKAHHSSENILKAAKEGWAIVLERKEKIVGTGTIVGDHIMRVFVEPEFQGQGLGRLIMQKLETKALSAGIGVVRLDSTLSAKKFYDLLGYETVEKTFVDVENGKRLDYYKMKKRLIS